MYCNYNVTTHPRKIVTTYPKVVFFTRNTCQSKTHGHKAVIIPSIYTTYILYFPTLSISSCSGIFLAQGEFFENVKNLLEEVKIRFLAITFS